MMKEKPVILLLFLRCALVAAMSYAMYMALIRPTDSFIFHIYDKLLHGCTFLFLSFLLDYSFPEKKLHPWKPLFLLGYGILIEILQSFTHYREASALDVAADCLGLLGYYLLYPRLRVHTWLGFLNKSLIPAG